MKYILALVLFPLSLFSEMYDAVIFYHEEFGISVAYEGHIYNVIQIEHSKTCPCIIENRVMVD